MFNPNFLNNVMSMVW